MKKIKVLISTIVIVAFMTQSAFGWIAFGSLDLPKEQFPAKAEIYTIKSVGGAFGAPGFLTFNISSKYGNYKPTGLVMLNKRLKEIQIIHTFASENAGMGVAKGMGNSLLDTGKGLTNLIIHPVRSVKGIGQATGKIGGRAGSAVKKNGDDGKEEKQGEKDSKGETKTKGDKFKKEDKDKKKPHSNVFLDSTKRGIAKRLNFDVYSRNKVLQIQLNKAAKAQMGGQGIVFVGTLLIPIAGVAAIIVTAGGLAIAANQLVSDNSKEELYALNQKAFEELGLSAGVIKKIMRTPNYTPTDVTYLRVYLEEIKDLPGIEEIAKKAARARNEIEGYKILWQTRIVAENYKSFDKDTTMTVTNEAIIVEQPNSVIFVSAYDLLDSSMFGKSIISKVFLLKERKKKPVEIWNGGRVTEKFSKSFFLKGDKIQEMMLFNGKSKLHS